MRREGEGVRDSERGEGGGRNEMRQREKIVKAVKFIESV